MVAKNKNRNSHSLLLGVTRNKSVIVNLIRSTGVATLVSRKQTSLIEAVLILSFIRELEFPSAVGCEKPISHSNQEQARMPVLP